MTKQKGHVVKAIRRKFEYSVLPFVAEKYLQKLLEEELQTKKIETIYDVYDELAIHLTNFQRPLHLDCYIEALQEALVDENEDSRLVFHAPPQFYKTTTSVISLIFSCLTQQDRKHIYITYNEDRALDILKEFTFYLQILGVSFYKSKNTVHVRSLNCTNQNFTYNNLVRFTSVKGSVTGYSVNGLVLIDDPIKGDEAASSNTQKQHVINFFNKELMTRKSKKFSIVLLMTRWSATDFAAHLIEKNFKYIRLAALCDNEETDPNGRKIGESLNEEARSAEELLSTKKTVGDYVWSAMYQGLPFTEGLQPFAELNPVYEDLDFNNSVEFITNYGLDLAYSNKKTSDYCVLVQLKTSRLTGISYVTKVLREQNLYDKFFIKAEKIINHTPGKVFWFTGGYEEQTAAVNLRNTYPQINLITKKTKGNTKYIRALNSHVVEHLNKNIVRFTNKIDNNIQLFIKDLQIYQPDSHDGSDSLDALVAVYDYANKTYFNIQKNGPIDIIASAIKDVDSTNSARKRLRQVAGQRRKDI